MTSILKVDTIQDADGNNIINESGNTITIGASGDTTNIIGTLQNDGAAVGGTNTPAFFATLSADQSISDTTAAKVQINNEIYDTANAYDNSSNYRFTPQTAGKYIIYSGIMINGDSDNDIEVAELYLNKNSTVTAQATFDSSTNYLREVPLSLTFSVDMNGSSDYVEMYVYANFVSGGGTVKGHSDPRSRTYFGAYKLVE
jgi:hypothetical protein